ncbi:MAG: MFS transporter [Rhodospirillales bacterium]|nr:MFS transporter [Rhodospirillales bacterium]
MIPATLRSLLAFSDFRFYLAARFLVMLGMQVVNVGVGWQVYRLSGDPMDLGYVGLAQFLPALLLTLPGGLLADRCDRKRILFLGMLVNLAAVLGLMFLSLRPDPPLSLILALLVVIGAGRAFLAPASQSVLPLLVPPEMFPRAVAVASTSWQVAVILGPALGGLLYVFGPVTVYAAAALLLACGALSVLMLNVRLHARSGDAEGILAGVRFVLKNRDILGAVSLDLFAVLLGGATALLPIYASDILMTGPMGLGFLRASPAIGAAFMAALLARHPIRGNAGRKMFLAVAVFGLATVAFGLSTNFLLSMAALMVLGAADIVSVIIRQTLVQLKTPDVLRGRVSAVNLIFITSSNELGEFESGFTAALFGAVPAVVLGGIGSLGVAAIWAWKFPSLRRVDKLEG